VGIRVVTDSSCDLPAPLVEALGIEIVPLTIRFGTEEYVDQVELSTAAFWEKVQESSTLPETAAPSPGAFETCFRELMARGASGIVCINLSSHLSGTMQSAQVAAAAVSNECPVQVIDSQTASMGLGNLCLTAARRAADGDSLESIVAEVSDRRDRTRLFATLDTLDHIRKSGRIGNARALLGSMLSIKPVVEIREGVVNEGGRVRTRSKALKLLASKAAESRIEHLAVLHANAPDADELLEMLAPIFPRDEIVTGIIGPVIGTHAGPRVIGVSYQVVDD
jgi:DegV family protein with EDD domain